MTFAQLLNHEEEIYKDRSTLDALYVTDVAKGFVQAATKRDRSSIYHLTSGKRNQWFIGAKLLGACEELLKESYTGNSHSLPKKQKNSYSLRHQLQSKKEYDNRKNMFKKEIDLDSYVFCRISIRFWKGSYT